MNRSHQSVRPAHRSAALFACLAGVWLSGCGAGLAGGVSSAGGGGGGDDPDGVVLLVNESIPKLSLTPFNEPTTPNSFPAGAVPAEPTELIQLQFSGPIDTNYSVTDFHVALKRPMGEFVEVPLEEVVSPTSRTVCIKLRGTTLHNSMYRIKTPGLRAASGGSLAGGQQSFFVVRDGVWSTPELISAGDVAAGGVTITRDLNLFATLEETLDLDDGLLWTNSFISARFGAPWQFPTTVFTRRAVGTQSGVQFQTGTLGFSEEVGFYHIGEGNPNQGEAINLDNILRAPVGLLTPVNGLQFGPQVDVVQSGDPRGRLDAATPGQTDELDGPHFSFAPSFTSEGRSVGAAFWALSNPQDTPTSPAMVTDLVDQKVYGASTMAAPVPADVGTITWADWGGAVALSAPGEDHNSWPLMASFPSGETVVMWWSSATAEGIFDDMVDKYWLARWTPSAGWGAAVDVTPAGAQGTLPPLTNIKSIEGLAGTAFTEDHMVVFSRDQGVPAASLFNLATNQWTGPATSPALIPGVAAYETFKTPTLSDYQDRITGTLPYSSRLRPAVGAMTPKASSTGGNEFLVRWTDVAQGIKIFVAEYAPGNPVPWGVPQDLSGFANISAGDPADASVNLAVDGNGWATLIFRQPDPTSTNRRYLFARRTNIPVSGAVGLADAAIPSLRISPEGFDAQFPSGPSLHPSGAMALSWSFRLEDNTELLGAAVARFQ